MNENQIQLVYIVTSYGKVVGTYADSNDAFTAQMTFVNKGRLAELVPCPVVYSDNLKSSENQIQLVYIVTSYGKVVGTYADSNDAFTAQMTFVNKGRLAELVPCQIVYPANLKSSKK